MGVRRGSRPDWFQHYGPGTWGAGGGILPGRYLRVEARRETEFPHPPEGSEEAWLGLETRKEARWRSPVER